MTTGEIYDFIDSFAPFHSAMSFDNPGLLVGSRNTSVKTALFALDITPDVVKEANMIDAQLVISHHPVIFNPLKCLNRSSSPYLLAQYGIDAICAHTNLDMSPKGVNATLAQRLHLKNVRTLSEYAPNLPEALMGELTQEYTPASFAELVKRDLNCDGLRYTDGHRTIRTVGLCSGGGADLLYIAAQKGCEGFVTGESKHNLLIDAETLNLTLVDAGHFFTEDIVFPPLMELLHTQFPLLNCVKSKAMHNPAHYI